MPSVQFVFQCARVVFLITTVEQFKYTYMITFVAMKRFLE